MAAAKTTVVRVLDHRAVAIDGRLAEAGEEIKISAADAKDAYRGGLRRGREAVTRRTLGRGLGANRAPLRPAQRSRQKPAG